MTPIHPQFVIGDDNVPTAVLLSIAEWERIVEELEELADIRAYDEAVARNEKPIPFDRAMREIEEGKVH